MIIFNDKYHYKNYVRKICNLRGLPNENFDKNYAHIFYSLYDFEYKYPLLLSYHNFQLIRHIAKRIGEYDNYQLPNLCYRLENSYEQLIIELNDISKKIDVHPDFIENKRSNYEIDITKYKNLHFIAAEQNKFVAAYKGHLELSSKFIDFISENELNIGLYFLYDEEKKLIYIGKSIHLGDRILDSIRERGAYYVSISITKTRSDMHVYEAYYIAKEKPIFNCQFSEIDKLTIKMKKLKRTKLLKIYK